MNANEPRFPGSWPRTLVVAACVAALQCAVILYMVWDRASLIKNGREIVLDVVPVDPRSLFRGDYVILSYDVSRIDAKLLPGGDGKASSRAVYVTLADESGTWKPVAASGTKPTAPEAGRIVMKGRARHWGGDRAASVNVDYGIESYFVPEGKGRELEKLVGEKKIKAVIAVGRDGTAAIKGLEIDGRRVYDTPLL